jgi:tRNA (mo5U34)-methyltransferase
LDIGELRQRADGWARELETVKAGAAEPGFPWYPYDTFANFIALDAMLTGPRRNLLELAGGKPLADIGAADGALAFFLGTLGHEVDILDYGPTNYNTLRGARLLKEKLPAPRVTIHELDLDSQFRLPRAGYGLIFFLGILYHLKNPYFVLEALARASRYLVLGTRVARVAGKKKTRIADLPVGYLVHPTETNNDSTNYWIFSPEGLRRIADRTGWEIRDFQTFGNTKKSDPATAKGDERAFCLLESRSFR